MPVYTYTTVQAHTPATKVHAGLNAAIFMYDPPTPTVFGTTGDVMLLARIPNKAVLTRVDGRCHNGAASMLYQLRLLYTEGNGSATSMTISPTITGQDATVRMTLTQGLPVRVNISEDQVVQHAFLAMVVTSGVSASVSFSLAGVVEYLADGS